MRIALLTIGFLLLSTCVARAQTLTVPPLVLPEVTIPETHPIVALDANERAPRDGMLIDDDDLVAWRHEIERLRYELGAHVSLAAATCDLRVHEEQSRTGAAQAEMALHESLWTARAQELTTALATARGREGPAWYEQPVLWTIVGAILGGAVVGVIAGAVR